MQAFTQKCCFDQEAFRETPQIRAWPSCDLLPSCPSSSSGQQQFVTWASVTISPEMMALLTWKERTLQRIQRWGFSWWKRFFSPCSPSSLSWHGLAPWTVHGRRKMWRPKGPFWQVKKQTPDWKGLLCLSQGEPSVTQTSRGGKGHRFSHWGWRKEERTRSLMANSSAAQLTPQKLVMKRTHCSNRKRAQAPHHKVWHLHENEGILLAGIQKQPKVP